MQLAVASCWAYRDAWKPFFKLLAKFWPNHPPPTIITDMHDGEVIDATTIDGIEYLYEYVPTQVQLFIGESAQTWCSLVADYAKQQTEPILLFQEDFFLTAPVNEAMISHACGLVQDGIACVRLYPCPGSDIPSVDPYYGFVSNEADYRISCQAAIWNPSYLNRIAAISMGSAASFEISGTIYARTQNDIIMACKRDLQPWPLQYICSGISRGMWNPDSKRLCDLYGIENDWSMRPFAS